MNMPTPLRRLISAIAAFAYLGLSAAQAAPSVAETSTSEAPRVVHATSSTPMTLEPAQRPLMAPDCTRVQCFSRSESPAAGAFKDTHSEQPVLMAPNCTTCGFWFALDAQNAVRA